MEFNYRNTRGNTMSEEKKEESQTRMQKMTDMAMKKIVDTIVPIIYFSWGMITGVVTCIVLWAGWN